jgi:ribosomal protein L16 Arg81 hydroxylase
MTLGALVELIECDPESGNVYLAAQNQALRHPALRGMWDDLTLDSGLLDPRNVADRVSLWFGPGNTVTPLHFDLQNTLLAQAYGRKRVTLFSPDDTPWLYNERGGYSSVDPEQPDLDRYPRFAQASPHTVVLEPGDALFLPVRWWHQVRSLSVSISLSIGNFACPNPTLPAGTR